VGIRPQESTWCYSVRSCRLMNSYRAGLDGPQAAWACRKYNGHRKYIATRCSLGGQSMRLNRVIINDFIYIRNQIPKKNSDHQNLND